MRDLPCEEAGECGIWASVDGCGGGWPAGLLEGPWDVICGREPYVPPQPGARDERVTGVSQVSEDAHSSTQGANCAARPYFWGFPNSGPPVAAHLKLQLPLALSKRKIGCFELLRPAGPRAAEGCRALRRCASSCCIRRYLARPHTTSLRGSVTRVTHLPSAASLQSEHLRTVV